MNVEKLCIMEFQLILRLAANLVSIVTAKFPSEIGEKNFLNFYQKLRESSLLKAEEKN